MEFFIHEEEVQTTKKKYKYNYNRKKYMADYYKSRRSELSTKSRDRYARKVKLLANGTCR